MMGNPLEITTIKKQDSIIHVCSPVYTLTLVDQVESSKVGLAFGGEADQDLVGGC